MSAQPRLKEIYETQVRPKIKYDLGIENPMAIPSLVKIVVNMGIGEASKDAKLIEGAVRDLTTITGQKPLVCKARKSIANFKLREGMPIGCKVTLRGRRMWEFYDRLVNVTLPRVRDFRGVSDKGFDGGGNYTVGLKDQLVFPEIDYSRVDHTRGMNITLVTTSTNDEGARALLAEMAFPFTRPER